MAVMNISEVMDRSIDVLKKNIKSIILFSLGYGAIIFGVTFVLIIVVAIGMAILSKLLSAVVLGIILTFLGIFLFSFYLSSHAGMVKIASQDFLNEQVAAHDAIKASFKIIPKLFCIVFLAMLMFLPVAGIFGAVIYFLFDKIKDSMLVFEVYGALGAKQIMLIILPILLALAVIFCTTAFSTWFCFVVQAVTVEKAGIIGSIKKSFTLVRKNFWSIFWCIILFNLTTYVFRSSLDGLLGILTTIFYFLEKFFNIKQDFITYMTTIFSMLRWPVSILYTLVIMPIGTIMMSNLYFNQRFKKEGYDLQLRLMEIQKNQAKEQLSEGV
jgi:hypothetical protein